MSKTLKKKKKESKKEEGGKGGNFALLWLRSQPSGSGHSLGSECEHPVQPEQTASRAQVIFGNKLCGKLASEQIQVNNAEQSNQQRRWFLILFSP